MTKQLTVSALGAAMLAGAAGCAVYEDRYPRRAVVTEERVVVDRAGPPRRTVVRRGPAVVEQRDVVVRRAPPPRRVEVRTVQPSPRHVYTAGHWRWTGRGHEWVPGTWVVPPRRGVAWVEGEWVRAPGGWVWREGYWR